MNAARTLATTMALAAVGFAADAWADAPAPPRSEGTADRRASDGDAEGTFTLGEWTFAPRLEVRLRGEYRRAPVAAGGLSYDSWAVQSDGAGESLVAIDSRSAFQDQWFVGERARAGLSVERGPVVARLTLQDARVAGGDTRALRGAGESTLPSTAPYEAFVEVHTTRGRHAFVRLGRQRVTWGDGRLLSDNDDSPTGRTLDAVRGGLEVGDFDFEALGAILEAPGALPPEVVGTERPEGEGSGVQLYGLRATWHFDPWLRAELTGFARFVRPPHSTRVTPGDTYVADGRVFGEHRGFAYAIEGAYEPGRVASFGANRDVSAFALAGRASLETKLPWHLTFGARGAYASGAGGAVGNTETQHRFDPLLPDAYTNHGASGFYAWSNLIEAGGWLSARPIEEVDARAGYTFVGLAEPDGRWTTAALVPVGAAPTNESRVLGHALEAALSLRPFSPLSVEAAYGLLLLGDGGDAILGAAGRGTSPSHWVLLETKVVAP